MAGKGGGAWKVAYADFVTAMMAFFLVMWITAQGKEVKEAVAQYFKDPYMVPGSSAGGPLGSSRSGSAPAPRRSAGGPKAPGRGAPAKATLPGSPERPGPDNPHMLAVHDGKYTSVGTLVVFAEDAADLDAEGKRRLKELLPMICGKPNKIEIRGHASGRPLPSGSPYRDGWQISFARCLATMKYLEQGGVEAQRVRLSQAGPFEPYTIRSGLDQQAQNSRIEVYMLGELTEDLIGTPEERARRFRP
jgi:chemotaxis protein MotB